VERCLRANSGGTSGDAVESGDDASRAAKVAREEATMLTGAEHVRRYVETNGAEGHHWEGTVALLLTTVGRKSGESRTTPLIYAEYGDAYVIVASNAGGDRAPGWYANLRVRPEVQLQVGPERFLARARAATEIERPMLWQKMLAAWPALSEYQERTVRIIPVIVLERI
jgi:deazaflavin-dependent oxidoreductase (nitroreductase family)